jgi:hypothetical protein
VTCVNHADRPATVEAAMPAAQKQRDGTYIERIPLCADCGARVATIGFGVRVEERGGDTSMSLTPVHPAGVDQ